MWQQPDWRGRKRVETWFKPNTIFGRRPIGLVWIEQKETYGWYREWHLVTYDEGQVNTHFVAGQDFITTTGASTYTSKASWNNANNTVEVIGGGGAGARGASTSTGGGGGAGGGYNKITNFTFATPGTTTASVSVGIGGVWTTSSITNGGDTWFNDTVFPTSGSKVGAKGGPSPATNTTATGATAALTSTFFPTTSPPARAGGNGAAGTSASAGGGGGGAGGPNGAGGNASATTGGTADGGTVTGGAAGNPGTAPKGSQYPGSPAGGIGAGGGGSNASGGAGAAATGYGGGAGAGSRSTGTGANGFQGIIVLSWVATTAQTITFSSNTTETLNTRKPKTVPIISSSENVFGSAYNVLYRRQTGPGIAETLTLARLHPTLKTILVSQSELVTLARRLFLSKTIAFATAINVFGTALATLALRATGPGIAQVVTLTRLKALSKLLTIVSPDVKTLTRIKSLSKSITITSPDVKTLLRRAVRTITISTGDIKTLATRAAHLLAITFAVPDVKTLTTLTAKRLAIKIGRAHV